MHGKGRRQSDVRSFCGTGQSHTAGCSVPGAGTIGHRHQRQVRSTQHVSDMMKALKLTMHSGKGEKYFAKDTMPMQTAVGERLSFDGKHSLHFLCNKTASCEFLRYFLVENRFR